MVKTFLVHLYIYFWLHIFTLDILFKSFYSMKMNRKKPKNKIKTENISTLKMESSYRRRIIDEEDRENKDRNISSKYLPLFFVHLQFISSFPFLFPLILDFFLI